MRVLLVEDDLLSARSLAIALRASSLVVDTIGTGEEALALTKRYDYDIVILDLMLPDMEGYDVVRRMRTSRIETPVLILSGLAHLAAKVKGFGLGADDFISKPCHTSEVIARIQAIVRRSKGCSHPVIHLGNMQVNIASRQVLVDGVAVHLSNKEFSILELLVLRKGVALPKEAFLDHLYGGIDEPDIKIIDVFICKLRKKLATAGAGNLIGTVWGRGYVIRDPSGERRPLEFEVPKPSNQPAVTLRAVS